MKLATVLLTIFLVTRSAFADETNLMLTVDGVTYSNVTFGAATPVSLSVRHSTGVASIPLAKLPQEIQKRFEYDPQKAADYVQKQGVAAKLAAERAEQERQRQTARQWADALAKKEQPRYREISGKLYDFSSAIAFANQEPRGFFVGGDYMRSIGGNLPPGVVQSQQAAAAYQAEMAKWGKYLIRGKVIQVLQDGLLVDGDSKIVFVKNYPLRSSVVDGDSINFVAMPVGSYSYTSTTGARITVRAYDFGTPPSGTANATPVQPSAAGEN